jgi:hypothetical protein
MSNPEELQSLLRFFTEEILASQVELSEATGNKEKGVIGISRPSINKFLKDGGQLSISRDNLIELHKALSKGEPSTKIKSFPELMSDDDKKQKLNQAIEKAKRYRKILGNLSPDELLEAAGYLPENAKSLRVSPAIFSMISQISIMLEIMNIEDALQSYFDLKSILYNKLRYSQNQLFPQTNEKIEDYLEVLKEHIMVESYLPLGLKERVSIQKKLEKAHKKLKQGGKKTFSQSEALSLFQSIVIKEKMAKNLVNLSIRLEKIEYETLSLSIESQSEFQDLHHSIFTQIARQEELRLAGYDDNGEDSSYDSSPVLLAKLFCNFQSNNKLSQKLKWIYTSSSTPLENAIAAVGLHLGLTQELESIHFLSTKVLDSRINGLIETTVILKDGNNQYQSSWVARDSIQTNIQAIISAVIQWISHESSQEKLNESNDQDCLDLELYESLCVSLSKIRNQLFDSARKFNDFQFFDDQNEKIHVLTIAEEAMKQLQRIPSVKNNKKDIYLPFRKNLVRCFFHAKLIILRKANSQGDIRAVKNLIDELKSILENHSKEEGEFRLLNILLEAEEYLYQLSSGQGYVFDSKPEDKQKNLEQTVQDIIDSIGNGKDTIGNNKFYKDPGMDVHYSLSETYGNIARFNFYFSDSQYILEKVKTNFLNAAYHASRIGYNRRTARWIALAGRASVRLKDEKFAQEAIALSTTIINLELNTQYQPIFHDALLSETNLLRGEYYFMKQENEKALYCFLRSLKGSVYLGLSRRLSDSLYNISRCARKISNKMVESVLTSSESPFLEFLPNAFVTNSEKKLQLEMDKFNPQGNPASAAAIRLLNELCQDVENKRPTWANVAALFLAESQNIWQSWYDETANKSNQKHSVVILLEEGKWLAPINVNLSESV